MKQQKENFGEYIKARRVELGKTQQEVAKKVGVNQNFIAYLESGQRKPSTELIKKLSGVLKLPTDKLYFLAHDEKLEGIVDYRSQEGMLKPKMAPVLAALASNRDLRSRYQITDDEIEQLASIRGRGEIKTEQDYVFLLTSLRQVFR